MFNGKPLVYRVTLPTQNPIPKIKEIYHNGQQLCINSGSNLSEVRVVCVTDNFHQLFVLSVRTYGSVTTSNLKHTFTSGFYQGYNPYPQHNHDYQLPEPTMTPTFEHFTTRPPASRMTTKSTTTTTIRPTHWPEIEPTPTPVSNFETDFECGVRDFATPFTPSGLVHKGRPVVRGQFPW